VAGGDRERGAGGGVGWNDCGVGVGGGAGGTAKEVGGGRGGGGGGRTGGRWAGMSGLGRRRRRIGCCACCRVYWHSVPG